MKWYFWVLSCGFHDIPWSKIHTKTQIVLLTFSMKFSLVCSVHSLFTPFRSISNYTNDGIWILKHLLRQSLMGKGNINRKIIVLAWSMGENIHSLIFWMENSWYVILCFSGLLWLWLVLFGSLLFNYLGSLNWCIPFTYSCITILTLRKTSQS